ncbi:hypothetical protein AGLY_002074 [Aphis glycines]|uniref:CCHC-type domain-containing protein n=1 Tax=Aphis glycines TaxID=307491 RepID=A0A6G0U3I5_APHGL|nr:hypothetical protein AGLY_002074 [Aphis glycines]
MKLEKLRQGEKESTTSFLAEIESLRRQVNNHMSEKDICGFILKGKRSVYFDDNNKQKNNNRDYNENRGRNYNKKRNIYNDKREYRNNSPYPYRRNDCEERNYNKRDNSPYPSRNDKDRETRGIYKQRIKNINEEKRYAKYWQYSKENSRERVPGKYREDRYAKESERVTCYRCNERGHYVDNCKMPKND